MVEVFAIIDNLSFVSSRLFDNLSTICTDEEMMGNNYKTPILTVQRILGHQNVETTLRYARLYEGTVVNDYRRAMGMIEAS